MKKVHFQTNSGSPNSQEWHDWRAQGIGGSDAVHNAAKAGLISNPPSWTNGKKLLAQKLGVAKPTQVNYRMIRGTMLEETARERFEAESAKFLRDKNNAFKRFKEKTGMVMKPAFGEMESHPFIRASFDGLDFWGRILEIKCPSQEVHDMAKSGVIVPYYKPQLAHQLLVRHGEPKNWSGKEEVYFVTYNPDDPKGEDLGVVKIYSQELHIMATQLLNANVTFYNKWQSLAKLNLPKKVSEFEKKHDGLFNTLSEAKAKKDAALEFIKHQIQEKDYEPGLHSFSTKPHTSSSIDEERLLKRLFWDEVPIEYRKPSSMVLRVDKPDIEYSDAEQAEMDLIEAKAIIKALTPEHEKAKEEAIALANNIGYIQGEHFTLYEKKGSIDWNLVCNDNGLDKEAFTIRKMSQSLVLRVLPKPKPEALKKAS